MFKLVLEKAEEPEIKLPTSIGLSKKQSFRKTSTSALLTMPQPMTVWIRTNVRKFFKKWEYQTTLPTSWEICMQVKKQQLKQQTGSKLAKEYVNGVYYHLAYLVYIQGTSCKMPACMKHMLESRFQGEILIMLDMQITPPLWKNVRGTEEPLDKSERGEWKIWLKTQHSRN